MKNSNTIIELLKERLSANLPGRKAHENMAPRHKGNLYRSFDPPKDIRKSAVLLPLFYNDNNELSIIFTLRSSELKHHSGQICFPGGGKEGSETIVHTALRETWEEIGILSDKIEILGMLTKLYVPPSESVIQPIIGFIADLPELKMNTTEVVEILKIPISTFQDDKNLRKEIWQFKGKDIEVPFWKIHDKVPLWGATAMILNEFMDIYEKV